MPLYGGIVVLFMMVVASPPARESETTAGKNYDGGLDEDAGFRHTNTTLILEQD